MKTDFSLFQFQNTRGIVYIYSGTSWKLVWYGINNFEEKKINTNIKNRIKAKYIGVKIPVFLLNLPTLPFLDKH